MQLVVPPLRNTTSQVRPAGLSSAGSATNHIVATASPRTRIMSGTTGLGSLARRSETARPYARPLMPSTAGLAADTYATSAVCSPCPCPVWGTPFGSSSAESRPLAGSTQVAEYQTRAGLAREAQKPSARPGDITVGQYPLGRRGAPGRLEPFALPPGLFAQNVSGDGPARLLAAPSGPDWFPPTRRFTPANSSTTTVCPVGAGFGLAERGVFGQVAAPGPEAPRADGCGHLLGPVSQRCPLKRQMSDARSRRRGIIDVGAERRTRAGLARETQKPSARPGDITSVRSPSAVGAPTAPRVSSRCARPEHTTKLAEPIRSARRIVARSSSWAQEAGAERGLTC